MLLPSRPVGDELIERLLQLLRVLRREAAILRLAGATSNAVPVPGARRARGSAHPKRAGGHSLCSASGSQEQGFRMRCSNAGTAPVRGAFAK